MGLGVFALGIQECWATWRLWDQEVARQLQVKLRLKDKWRCLLGIKENHPRSSLSIESMCVKRIN